jgi:precorrin-6x reductase
MPFSNGTFANVAGASSAAAGQIVQSAVWNNIHTDYSAAFNQLMQQMVAQITNRNILYMNGGMEPNENSQLYKNYGIKLLIKK